MFGLMKRWSNEFDDPKMIKTLFILLVRPPFEYGPPVCSQQYLVHSDLIESVQKTCYCLPSGA